MATEDTTVHDNVLLEYLACREDQYNNQDNATQQYDLPIKKEPETLAEVLKQAEDCRRGIGHISPQPDASPSALDDLLRWRKSVNENAGKSPTSPKSFADVLSPIVNNDPIRGLRREQTYFTELSSPHSEGNTAVFFPTTSPRILLLGANKSRMYHATSKALKHVEGAETVTLCSSDDDDGSALNSGRKKRRRKKHKNALGSDYSDDSDADAHSGGAFAALKRISVTPWCGGEGENEDASPASGKVKKKKKKGTNGDVPDGDGEKKKKRKKKKGGLTVPTDDVEGDETPTANKSPRKKGHLKKQDSCKSDVVLKCDGDISGDESPVAASGNGKKKKKSARQSVTPRKSRKSKSASPSNKLSLLPSSEKGTPRKSGKSKSASPSNTLSLLLNSEKATPRKSGRSKSASPSNTLELLPNLEKATPRKSRRSKSASPSNTLELLPNLEISPTSKRKMKVKKESAILSPTSEKIKSKSKGSKILVLDE